MIMTIVMFLIGIGLYIVNSNGILIIDAWIIYIVFGIAGLLLIISIINSIRNKKMFNKVERKMRW